MRLTVLCDVDGICCDSVSASLEIIRGITGRTYTEADVVHWDYGKLLDSPEQVTEFWRQFNAPGFCAGLQAFAGAAEAIERLNREHDLCFVTSPSDSLTWAGERAVWLQKHFGVTLKQIISTSAKHRVRGDVLIDDSVDHIEAWSKAWPLGTALTWTRPYNAGAAPGHRVESWEDVFEVLEELTVPPC